MTTEHKACPQRSLYGVGEAFAPGEASMECSDLSELWILPVG
jgi:hypothetical protein